MQIIEKQIADLKPYGKNPRKNDEAVKYVAASIKEFGFKVPIVIDKDGVIVAGHTRYKAAKQLGLDTVPCIVADDLTPQQIKAFRLADNKVAEQAGWDFDLLGEELAGIDFDMTEFGFVQVIEDETPANIQKVELKPYHKVHYLISLDVNDNDKVIEFIKTLQEMEGIQVESTLN